MLKNICTALVICSTFLPTLSYAGKGTYGIGVEGFSDRFSEDDQDFDYTLVNTSGTGKHGSITGYYSNQGRSSFFALDGRISYGKSEYDSNLTGKLTGVPKWEFETRGRFGLTKPLWGGSFSPYTGLGLIVSQEQAKGYFTDLGYETFDRRTWRLYIPIGASLSFMTDSGWSITPQAEADVTFYGEVDDRLTNITYGGNVYTPGGFRFNSNAAATQHLGFGARGEVMFGKAYNGYALQAGPFVRYWYFGETNNTQLTEGCTCGAPTGELASPKNDRTQVGIAARVLW